MMQGLTGSSMRAAAFLRSPWQEPADVLAGCADSLFALGLLSGGEGARWSYVACDPDAQLILQANDSTDSFAALAAMLGPPCPVAPGGPPFQGGVAGLCAYELGAWTEGLDLARHEDWPDLAWARYPALLAFDHQAGEVIAVGRGPHAAGARIQARRAQSWLGKVWLGKSQPATPAPFPLADHLEGEPAQAYEAAAAEVVDRIGRGEIFQANIARRWRGRLARGAQPFDLMRRLLAQSPAPFAAYLRLADRAVVSNSPERFISVRPDGEALLAQAQPIKGTIRRGRNAAEDAALAAQLAASAKDRAENLMIVDLMRNDLARVCAPGTVAAPRLFEIEGFANVHHLVSTVTGRLAMGRTALDLLHAAFPPGSITGAPKHQAMKVIAGLEAPRGPFFGAMVWAGFDGAMDSSVLIRTAACVADAEGWRIEARAGGGVVADSDPKAEREETEAKFAALARALTQTA